MEIENLHEWLLLENRRTSCSHISRRKAASREGQKLAVFPRVCQRLVVILKADIAPNCYLISVTNFSRERRTFFKLTSQSLSASR